MRFYVLGILMTFCLGIQAQQPEPPEIKSVTVLNGSQVKISWSPSPSAGVSGYVLYRWDYSLATPNFTEEFTDIPGSVTSWIDTEAKADQRIEKYRIAAFVGDKSNISNPTDPQQTLYLKMTKYDSCQMYIDISWQPYQGWSDLTGYNIYRVVNFVPELIATAVQDTFYRDSEIEANLFVEYFVQAISESGDTAQSNNTPRKLTRVPSSPNPDNFFIDEAHFDGEAFTIFSQTSGYINSYVFQYAPSINGIYTDIDTLTASGTDRLQLTDDKRSAQQPLYYKVSGVNLCKIRSVETNIVRPIVLNIEKDNNDIQLDWNKGFMVEDENYQIELSLDSQPFSIIESGVTANSQTYNLDNLGTGGEEQFCFKITANTGSGYTGSSNTFCVDRIPEVEIPNAFTPNGDGLNDYIKPIIKNADIVSYRFIVYDKFGGKVFETDRPEEPWDGKANGRNIPEGGYIFYIGFKTALGKEYEKSGALNVVYP